MMEDEVDEIHEGVRKLKHQINAETALIQIILWIIIMKLFESVGWVLVLSVLMIIGNIGVLLKSRGKLGEGYFKD